LRVISTDGRHYIEVPSQEAEALHNYLRDHRIRSSPPEPSSSGVENIALHRGENVPVVQALLDGWD
jgi:hypothetical protein